MQGRPAVFVRFSGCNMECEYCDTKYHKYEYREVSIDDIWNEVAKYHCKYSIITGGEPFIQHDDIFLLIKKLSDNGVVEIETNGSNLDHNIARLLERGCAKNVLLTVDLKLEQSNEIYMKDFEKGISLLPSSCELYALTKEFPICLCIKVVVQNKTDIGMAYDFAQRYPDHLVIISPCYGVISPTEIAEYILNRNYRELKMQIQLHKYLWREDIRGR